MAYESWDVLVQYTAGVWTDITADVDSVSQAVSSTNGATPETTGEPGGMALVLNNVGFKYTPGNASSAFALRTGMPIRVAEVIAGTTVNLFTGFVEFPETDDVNLSETQAQTIAVNAVDQLSLWERSQTFVSTLSAHIKYNAAGTLARYWPPIGVSPYSDMVGSKTLLLLKDVGGEASFTEADGPVAVSDDFEAPNFVPGVNDISSYYLQSTDLSLAFTANQALTIVAWILPTATNQLSTDLINASISENAGLSALVVYETTAQLVASINFGGLSGTINSGLRLPVDVPTPIAVQYGYSPSLFEFWVGRNRFTGTLSGSAPSSSSVIQLILWRRFQGRIGHIQLHVGNAFTFTEYLAQYDVGAFGLERQTTGDRIKTLARYAGEPDYQLTGVDTGCSIMQPARLAGLNVAEAMYEARDTEQGDLYIDGDGNIVFHDRRTILNI